MRHSYLDYGIDHVFEYSYFKSFLIGSNVTSPHDKAQCTASPLVLKIELICYLFSIQHLFKLLHIFAMHLR